MSIKKKNINEMNASSAAQGHAAPVGNTIRRESAGKIFRKRKNRSSNNPSAPFVEEKVVKGAIKPAGAFVIKPKSKKERAKGKNIEKSNGTVARFETKSERMLRESIRELVLLSRVKYHEEQALREMQEQKLRGIIRKLLKEDSQNPEFTSTGAALAWDFIEAVKTLSFESSLKKLVSSQDQRNAYKQFYVTNIKLQLDSLDQQYLILHPDQKPQVLQYGGQQQQAAVNPTAAQVPPPARRSDKKLHEQESDVHPTAQPAAPNPTLDAISSNKKVDPKLQNIFTSAIQKVPEITKDTAGYGIAQSVLIKDLPQIETIGYNNLTFNPIQVGGRTSSDREEFRFFLIGNKDPNTGKDTVGNVQIFLDRFDKLNPIKGAESNTGPKIEPDPIGQETPPAATPSAEAPTPETQPEMPSDLGTEQPPEGEEEV